MGRNAAIKKSPRRALLALVGVVAPLVSGAALATASGEALVNSKCAACHTASGEGKWDRISDSRRTPEGWDMTVARMSYAHGVKLTDDERGAIVKYLANTYGLAPDETAAHRYIVDRTPSVVEHPENKLVGDTCARCHSYGRIAVQRRTEDDWRKLVHFHVGQFPAIEIQAGGRDRNWFDIATGDTVKALAEQYGFDSASWTQWKAQKPADASGTWRLVGHRPGMGAYEGTATIARTGDDRYSVDMVMRYENGTSDTAKGTAIVYTGHEWRASVKQGDREVNHVMSLGAGGNELSGRWFEANNDSIGGTMRAVRADKGAKPSVLSVQPQMLRAGSRARIAINGVGLDGEVDLGNGVKVAKVLERSADRVVVEVEVAKDAASGSRAVKVGSAGTGDALKIYQQIDYVKITPEHPMARVGGGGGPIPKVPVQLEAIAFAAGPDGKSGNADDVQLGVVPATWSVDNLHEVAAQMQDTKYAGRIEENGLFVPNAAGPNPERKYKTNNAGELKVIAAVKDGNRTVKASAPLIVTVQRFNDPPIR
ncbi:quinohemoprotein amine dehydrogenase, 60 kDa subunit [Aromatoleum aromaticum EbN1]|uniref:Quinohemoprotein amine dehydrogenase, 60 kDa subunit n=1 Tax=Aromatoleum aromaticum (strain DSM 19018 / LMG 30748 / EbN1) TaxID=76114 RepID=Q5P5Q6_AROAE|nr:quinohemoprotein amine dehydrogenase subunit alpha [Aromatoleum aromaticum]CAI07356.1 quinohemoprotein amine dehydrogenase, 60 kDa subunit [Aromatoleum aromaticum EbN1]